MAFSHRHLRLANTDPALANRLFHGLTALVGRLYDGLAPWAFLHLLHVCWGPEL